MSFERYNIIRNKLNDVQCSDVDLNTLKERYKNEVNSQRRLDYVNTLSELVNLLQKRDCVDKDNLVLIKEIATHLNENDIVELVDNKHPPRASLSRLDYSGSGGGNFQLTAKQRAYTKICEEIGKKWSELARALNVPEGKIDELNEQHKKISDRTMKVLLFHEDNCDPRTWKSALLNALDKARRKDLKNAVQNIFDVFG